jgi:toxin FitB
MTTSEAATFLLDTNIIIYAAQQDRTSLRAWIARLAPVVSGVSYVEALGYHQLGENEAILRQFFEAAIIVPITMPIMDAAIALRQQRRMSLGDSLIAGTALVHDPTLATHNVEDFKWIKNMRVFDPITI